MAEEYTIGSIPAGGYTCWSVVRCFGYVELKYNKQTGQGRFGTISEPPKINSQTLSLGPTSVGALKATQYNICAPDVDGATSLPFGSEVTADTFFVPGVGGLAKNKYLKGADKDSNKYPHLFTLFIGGSSDDTEVRMIFAIGIYFFKKISVCSGRSLKSSSPVEKNIQFSNIIVTQGELQFRETMYPLIISQLPPHRECDF